MWIQSKSYVQVAYETQPDTRLVWAESQKSEEFGGRMDVEKKMKSLCRKKVSSQVHSDDVSILEKKNIYI